ncbi:MAG: acetyl-CoA carboxylase biotin carboxyl carrier protein [Firmicutes bacterium]|nr:acetyl-CoA carboxylase biotin carboxyl carrier protein [Bacillota bacterium]
MKLSEIQKMIKDFENSNLTELELTFEDTTIKLSKQQTHQSAPAPVVSPSPVYHVPLKEQEPPQSAENTIVSPLVGTFYASSSPKSKPYVEVGSKVKKGDVLCLIEAMKIMNEITAPKDGTILKVHVMNGQVVGIDDALFDLE